MSDSVSCSQLWTSLRVDDCVTSTSTRLSSVWMYCATSLHSRKKVEQSSWSTIPSASIPKMNEIMIHGQWLANGCTLSGVTHLMRITLTSSNCISQSYGCTFGWYKAANMSKYVDDTNHTQIRSFPALRTEYFQQTENVRIRIFAYTNVNLSTLTDSVCTSEDA